MTKPFDAKELAARGTDGSGITQTRDPEQAILGGAKPDGTANIHVVSASVIRKEG